MRFNLGRRIACNDLTDVNQGSRVDVLRSDSGSAGVLMSEVPRSSSSFVKTYPSESMFLSVRTPAVVKSALAMSLSVAVQLITSSEANVAHAALAVVVRELADASLGEFPIGHEEEVAPEADCKRDMAGPARAPGKIKTGSQ